MEATKKDELFDDALCSMVKFTDSTMAVQKHTESQKKRKANYTQKKIKSLRSQPASQQAQNMNQLRHGMTKRLLTW